MEVAALLWPALGLLGYGLLVWGMSRWDDPNFGYLLVAILSLIAGPVMLVIALMEWQKKPRWWWKSKR